MFFFNEEVSFYYDFFCKEKIMYMGIIFFFLYSIIIFVIVYDY